MPWPRHHKAHTRARILAAAAAAIREKGPDGVAVAEVMDRAGLTHGGFYAHFASKDDLLAQALALTGEASLASLAAAADAASDGERLRAVVDAYLSPWHVAHVGEGCPVAALGPEVARGGGRLQRDLARMIRARVEWLRTLLPGTRRGSRRHDDAVGALAGMVGGLVLARALGGDDGRDVLAATRRFLDRALDDRPG
jgi:TetR/AcrR family transcriptional repressor of nem operon